MKNKIFLLLLIAAALLAEVMAFYSLWRKHNTTVPADVVAQTEPSVER